MVYHGEVSEDSDGPVEVCIPFSGPLDPMQNMTIRLDPEHHEAYASVTRAHCVFPEILKAYDAVDFWLREHQKAQAFASP